MEQVVGHPRPSLSGTGVPWVSCLDPPVCLRVQDDPEAKSNPSSCWFESCFSVMVVFVFVVVVEVVRDAFVCVTENTYIFDGLCDRQARQLS